MLIFGCDLCRHIDFGFCDLAGIDADLSFSLRMDLLSEDFRFFLGFVEDNLEDLRNKWERRVVVIVHDHPPHARGLELVEGLGSG